MKLYEIEFNLPKLSAIRTQKIGYNEFNDPKFYSSDPLICFVDDYPINETFFDALDKNGTPFKTELFFVLKDVKIEFAVLGKVGINLNPVLSISKHTYNLKYSNLWGGGIGIERILLCYSLLKSSLCNGQ